MASVPDWVEKRIRTLAKETVETHRFCDIGNPRHCDLYHNLIQDVSQIIVEAWGHMSEPMRCGHPRACSLEKGCMACRRERDVVNEVKFSGVAE